MLWAQSTTQGLTSGKTDHTEHSKFWLTQAIPASCQSNKTKQNKKKDKKKKKHEAARALGQALASLFHEVSTWSRSSETDKTAIKISSTLGH